MTTHVVCLDGTGQTRLQQNPTNIALIFNAMGGIIVDADNGSFESTFAVNGPVVQVGKYLSGVGPHDYCAPNRRGGGGKQS
jgi:hypothetical protein